MNQTDPTHPSSEQLRALVLGLMEEFEATTLGSHVWECEICLGNLEQLSDDGDPFLSKLRAVHSSPRPHAFRDETIVGGAARDTAPALPREPLGELTQLAQYRVLRRLCQGGMGVVFEAEDVHLRRRVALKILKPSLALDPSAHQRFLREARAAAALHHDHVVTIYHVGDADGPAGGVPFLAMELLEGASLETALARGPLSLAESIRIGREVAEGLAAAHAAGLIHRDVKPDNIWLEGDGRRVKLLDFGLARAVRTDAHLTARGLIVGTPAYMAPEQAAGRELDGRADLFSLGCVLYRLCTGRLPFPTSDVMATLTALATMEPDPVGRLNPAVPPALANLIQQLLAKAPTDRPQSAAAVAATLRDIEEGRSSAWRFVRGQGQRRAILIGLAGLLLLAGVILLRLGDFWESGGAANSASGGGNDGQPRETPPTFVVDTLVDENDGILVGKVSLRDAIAAANIQTGDDTIHIKVSGTITLTNGQLILTDNTTVSASGAAKLTVSGNKATRVFQIEMGVTAALNGLTIADGMATDQGGGIVNLGMLTVTNCNFRGNTASSAGGGILNSASLTVTGSTFSGNHANGGVFSAGGGGIFNTATGDLTLTDSTVSGNTSISVNTNRRGGGGILNDGILHVSATTISGNAGSLVGGGILNNGTGVGAPVADQRGVRRVGAVDIGAFEYVPTVNR